MTREVVGAGARRMRLRAHQRGGGALTALARSRWRRRAGSLAGLAALVGLAGSVSLVAVAGARRTDSTLPRLLEAIEASHAVVEIPADDPEGFSRLGALEPVSSVAPFATMFVAPAGDAPPSPLEFVAYAAVDGSFARDQDKARVLAGRLPRPDRAEEVAVSEALARRLGLRVNDPLPLQSISPAQLEAHASQERSGGPSGPELTATVSGIVRLDFNRLSGGPQEVLLLTPAFWRSYRDAIVGYGNVATVRLDRGQADFDAFASAARALYGDSGELSVRPLGGDLTRIREPLDVQVIALLLFALVAGIAGLIVTGQATARLLALDADEEPVLAALGLTRTERVVAGAMGVAPALVGGVVLATAGAVAASPLLPFGLARTIEPAPGPYADLTVLLLGAVVISVALALATVVTTAGAGAAVVIAPTAAPAWSAAVARQLRLRPPAAVGTLLAFERSRGPHAVPVRQALAGTAAGILGLAAALVFSSGLERLLDSPSRFGWAWDLAVGPGDDVDDEALERAALQLTADPDVSAVSAARFSSLELAGTQTQAVGLERLEGDVSLTLLAGRAAMAPDEALAGRATLRRLGARLGDTIEAPGREGAVRLRVVGTALFPTLADDEPSEGLALTNDGLARLEHAGGFPQFLVRVRTGADRERVQGRLAARFPQVQDTVRPSQVGNLDQVRRLPSLLAGFLAVLGAAALAHAVLSAVRRRRRHLAVLKALGFTRRETGETVVWQASALVVAGSIPGVVLGVVAGRWAWSLVARAIDVADDPLVPIAAVVLIVPGALLVANLVALLPALAAARTTPAAALRAE